MNDVLTNHQLLYLRGFLTLVKPLGIDLYWGQLLLTRMLMKHPSCGVVMASLLSTKRSNVTNLHNLIFICLLLDYL